MLKYLTDLELMFRELIPFELAKCPLGCGEDRMRI